MTRVGRGSAKYGTGDLDNNMGGELGKWEGGSRIMEGRAGGADKKNQDGDGTHAAGVTPLCRRSQKF